MQKIVIDQLGPIEHCELKIQDFIVFTGPQASGKSTIAKSIFFFKNIRNVLYMQIKKQFLLNDTAWNDSLELSIKNRLLKEIRSNFLQTFGTTWCMEKTMCLQYFYTDDVSIKISLKPDSISPNYVWIEFSYALTEFLDSIEKWLKKRNILELFDGSSWLKKKIDDFFKDDAEIIYIPAGRSMITLLSTQLNYIYSSMDDMQKRNLDYCTQDYLERILRIKPEFSSTIAQMIQNIFSLTTTKVNKELIYAAAELMKSILKGEYRNVNGEERLQVSEDRYVKINFASSGQQEAVWILNVLFYSLLNNKKSYFIIEEPESHLFPNAQKQIAEFISMARSDRNQILITTHSPYVLGTINNLLYAEKISKFVNKEDLQKIIPENEWLSFANMQTFYVQNGKVESCTDDEFGAIKNEVIDGVSDDINHDYDEMVLLKERYTGEEVD